LLPYTTLFRSVEPPHPVRRKAVVGDLETIPDAPQLHVETGLGGFDPHGLGPTEPFDASDDVRLNAHHNTRRHLARRGIAAVNGVVQAQVSLVDADRHPDDRELVALDRSE